MQRMFANIGIDNISNKHHVNRLQYIRIQYYAEDFF